MVVTIETLAFEGGNDEARGVTAVDPRIWRIWKDVKDGVLARRVV